MIATGTRLGHYTINGPIGAGGMGAVYEAIDERLQRRVAIKVLSPHLAAGPEALQRFRQEARAASALNHPNIVHIYAIEEVEVGTESVACIVMELIEGETLRRRISDRTPASLLLEPLTQVAEAIAKAHESGIIHRDLKPENIMIHRDGYAKVVDFGLAKLLQKPAAQSAPDMATEPLLTDRGSVRGTAAYMSPEQARGEQADARSDVFTLGCILYEVLAGRKPFQTDTVVDTLWAIIHSEPAPLANADPELARIVGKCMEKDPARRYSTARGLAEALQLFRRGSSTAPVIETVLPSPRRRAAIIGALVVVLIAIAGTLFVVRPRMKHQVDAVAVLPFVNVKHDPDA